MKNNEKTYEIDKVQMKEIVIRDIFLSALDNFEFDDFFYFIVKNDIDRTNLYNDWSKNISKLFLKQIYFN